MKMDASQLKSPALPSEAADAFVFFGATGDLAYKQIFRALQQMILRDGFNLPIIGVAKSGWTIDQLKARVRDSLTHNGGIDENGYAKLIGLLQYIDGDYADPKTFEQLRKALGTAQSPVNYLAIPPDLFGSVVQSLGKSNYSGHPRVIIEKPFGRNLASARKLNATLHAAFPESAIFRIDHFLAKSRWRICTFSGSPIHFSNQFGTVIMSIMYRSPWPNLSAWLAAAVSTMRVARYGT